MSDPMALDAAEDLLILPPSSPLLPSPRSFASSLSSSAPDTPTPAPLAASTTVTISGVDEPDVLVDELKRVGRIVACRKGKNWAAVKFEGMAGVKAAMKMNNRLWRDCLLTVKMGDTLNALADVQQQQQSAAQRGREPSRGQQRVAGTALSVPIPIPGAANSSSSSKRASHFAPMDVPPSLPQHPAPKARLIVSSGDDDNEQRQTDNDEDDSAPPTNNTLDSPPSADAWKHAPVSDKKTATSSSATKDKGSKRSNNKPAPLSASHKRPRESDDASALPPSRRTATSNASGGSKAGRRGKDQYSDDEDDVVVRPAGFLATLSDWVFGW
ncbi:hypothetical protein HKX48_006705 [Thoreauomyces humboldtii]|nr:hypothetical protein HKX48_006705 [Thoreauomyces humboldtii]